MKRVLILFYLLPIFCIAQDGGVHFLEKLSWQEIKEKAQIEHKYIFVDCFATWCGPCKAMDKRTYPIDSVADVMNRSFLSVRVQCDTSKKDSDAVKAKYADAHEIVTAFKINAYPTFLFFSPDGKLVHKGIGYHDPHEFIELALAAINPAKQYFTLIKNYQTGKMGYSDMTCLADLARKFDDTAIFSSISRSCIHNYLNLMPDSDLSKRSNFDLVMKYYRNLTTQDRLFIWLIHHPQIGDSLMKKKGLTNGLVESVIYQEELSPSLVLAKGNGRMPDWEAISKGITKKYGSTYKSAILKAEMNWYEFKKDSENFCKAAIERIKNGEYARNPLDPNNQEILNTFAFGIFLRSNDKNKLKEALSWSDLTVSAITDSSARAGSYIDTKANLLYKLGNREDALALETKAAQLSPYDGQIRGALHKMEAGKPTW